MKYDFGTLQSCDITSPSVTDSLFSQFYYNEVKLFVFKFPSVRLQCLTLLVVVVRLKLFVFLILQG